jgi:lysophospholipase L1-like esterase
VQKQTRATGYRPRPSGRQFKQTKEEGRTARFCFVNRAPAEAQAEEEHGRMRSRKSILAVGDSLTAGFYNGGASFFPYTTELERLVKQNHASWKNSTVTELGTCGATLPMIKTAMACHLKELAAKTGGAPTICVVLGGTNDLRAFPVVEPGTEAVLISCWCILLTVHLLSSQQRL